MDGMHIEANVAKNVLQTLCGFDKKDNESVRESCESPMVLPMAHMIPGCSTPPNSPWIFTREEKQTFKKRLPNIKFPIGYGVGFSKSFSGTSPKGLKSHDYHCLLQHGFPIAICGLLTPKVWEAVDLLSSMFKYFSGHMSCYL